MTIPMTPQQRVDEALCSAALALAGHAEWRSFHTTLLGLVDEASTPLARRTAAALYGVFVLMPASVRQALDGLEAARSVHDAIVHGDGKVQHEDLRCFPGPDGYCTTCRGIATDRLRDELTDVYALLGEGAMADLLDAAA